MLLQKLNTLNNSFYLSLENIPSWLSKSLHSSGKNQSLDLSNKIEKKNWIGKKYAPKFINGP